MKNKNFSDGNINSLCNICLLPSDANKKISNNAPSKYIIENILKGNYADTLKSNFMPITSDIYKNNNYEKFLNERAHKIFEFIEEQLVL